MKRINRCNEVVKFLSAARCCAKAVVDVAAVEFRFSAVKFVKFIDSGVLNLHHDNDVMEVALSQLTITWYKLANHKIGTRTVYESG